MKKKQTKPTLRPARLSAPTHTPACIRARAIAEALVAIDRVCDLGLQPRDFAEIGEVLGVSGLYLASVSLLGGTGPELAAEIDAYAAWRHEGTAGRAVA